MASFHEARKHLSKKTRDMHRALLSLQEEPQAIDWYCQRVDACHDTQLRDILLHDMREEMEHSAMLIEWLRRKDSDFDRPLNSHQFSDAPTTGRKKTFTDPVFANDSRSPTIRQPETELMQIDHLKSLCTHGVYKAELDKPVVVDNHAGALVLGQDLHVGYAGSDGIHYQLFVCESMVLRLDEPEAVCVLTD